MSECVCDEPLIRCDAFGKRCAVCGGEERMKISTGLQKAIDDTRADIRRAAMTTPTPAQAVNDRQYPKIVWLDRDEETNEKRWYSVRGWGVEYVRADAAAFRPEGEAVAWPIATDDQVEALARECGWHNRKYMTPADYAIWCDRMRKFARLAATPPAPAQVETASLPAPGGVEGDVPMGAIENGRAFADRLERTGLECPAGDLRMCSDWQEFRHCFEHLAEWALSVPARVAVERLDASLAGAAEVMPAQSHTAMVKALTVCRATLPHMGGSAMATDSLIKEIDAAIATDASPRGEGCDEQLALAKRLAEDLGYVVVPDPIHADGEIHAPEFVLQMQPSLHALGFHAIPLATPPAKEHRHDD